MRWGYNTYGRHQANAIKWLMLGDDTTYSNRSLNLDFRVRVKVRV